VTSLQHASDDRELLRRYHVDGDASAREELVNRHLPLVRSLARRYAGRGEALARGRADDVRDAERRR
jgi:DNA-directed RNA polymerase specialized sigma subunit